jgi:hypothetical protein
MTCVLPVPLPVLLGVLSADGTLLPLIGAGLSGESSLLLTTSRRDQTDVSIQLALGSPRRAVASLLLRVPPAPRGCTQLRLHARLGADGSLAANFTDMASGDSVLLRDCKSSAVLPQQLPRPFRFESCGDPTRPLEGFAVGDRFIRLEQRARERGHSVPRGGDGEVLPSHTADRVWAASVALAARLQHETLRGARVIELGAGAGLAGLAAASLGAERVTLTDLEANLPLLSRNAAANGLERAVAVSPLDWTSPQLPAALRDEPFDLVLAADVVHWEALFRPLLRTMVALLRGGAGRALLALTRRQQRAARFLAATPSEQLKCTPLPPVEGLHGAGPGGETSELFECRVAPGAGEPAGADRGPDEL